MSSEIATTDGSGAELSSFDASLEAERTAERTVARSIVRSVIILVPIMIAFFIGLIAPPPATTRVLGDHRHRLDAQPDRRCSSACSPGPISAPRLDDVDRGVIREH
jgi:hypothetical protein